jgi:hypothetical protein
VWRLYRERPHYTLDQIREMSLDDVELQLLYLDRVEAAHAEARERARDRQGA